MRPRDVDEEPHLLDRVLSSAPGPKSIRGRAEVRLEDRLEHELGRRLHDPVAHRRDAQASELPRALRDQPLAGRQRPVAAALELLTKLVEHLLHADLLDPLAGLAIDTGGPRPPVAFHSLPRDEQRRGVADQVEQVAEALLLVLGCPSVQLGLPSQYPLLGHVARHWCGRIHARPPEQRLLLRSCCPPSPCAGLSPARTTTRTPSHPARVSRHRVLPGRRQRPRAHGALPTFTMIRLTGSAACSTPTAHPAGPRSIPPATMSGSNIRAWSAPPSNGAASLLSTAHVHQVSGRLRNRGASTTSSLSLCLSVSLARTRASGSAARPSRCRVASPYGARFRARMDPSFSRPLHQPGAGILAGTDEMLFVLHLLSHGASWRTVDFLGFHHRWGRGRTAGSTHVEFLARWPSRQAMQHARDRVRGLTARDRLRWPVEQVVGDLNRFLRLGGLFPLRQLDRPVRHDHPSRGTAPTAVDRGKPIALRPKRVRRPA